MTDSVVAERFGYYACDRAGFEQVWVQFRPSGYPFGLRRKWLADTSEVSTIETVLGYVQDWQMPALDGAPIRLPQNGTLRTVELVDDVDIAVVTWLIQTFAAWLLRDVGRPPKNSSPPLAAMSQPTAVLQTN
mgnify:FL=1